MTLQAMRSETLVSKVRILVRLGRAHRTASEQSGAAAVAGAPGRLPRRCATTDTASRYIRNMLCLSLDLDAAQRSAFTHPMDLEPFVYLLYSTPQIVRQPLICCAAGIRHGSLSQVDTGGCLDHMWGLRL